MDGHEMRRRILGAVHGVMVPSGTHAIAGEDAGGRPIGTVGIVSTRRAIGSEVETP